MTKHKHTGALTCSARLGAVVAAAAMLLSLPTGAAATPARQAAAVVEFTGPAQVAVDEAIELVLSVSEAGDVAGYETALLFDTTMAEFAGLEQRDNDLARLGRGVSPFAALGLANGAAFGMYSCPTADCVTQAGPRLERGAQGQVRLATFYLVAHAPGILEIKLDATKLVDAAGNPLPFTLPQPTLTVQVGAAGEGSTYAAPGSMWALAPTAAALDLGAVAQTPGALDMTGDRRVNSSDVMEVVLAWETLRLEQVACGPLPEPALDINRDGCVDVADMQLLAASDPAGTPPPAPVEGPKLYLPLLLQDGTDEGPPMSAAMTFTVNTAGDGKDANFGDGLCQTAAGLCSLRAAIQEANARPGPDTIVFSIGGGGVKTILLTGALPALNDTSGPTTIDGYTQPGASPNTSQLASNAQIRIQIEGKGEGQFDGFTITSAGNVIRGVAVYKVRRAFWIRGSGAVNNTIVGNFIGTNAAGTYGAPAYTNLAHGVHIEQGAANNRIGTPALADRNVISGNGSHGVGLWHQGTNNNLAENNLIGLTPAGDGALPNRRHGMDLNFGAAFNRFGGAGAGQRNVVSGNAEQGIEVSHTPQTTQNQVIGNYIGTNLSGTASPAWAGNGLRGILVEDRATGNLIAQNVIGGNTRCGIEIFDNNTHANEFRDNRIGISTNDSAIPNACGVFLKGTGHIVGPGNVIAWNTNVGVKLEDDVADFNTITRNSIFNNGGLGIDLWPRGVNLNDQYPHTGPNQRLNFPVLTSATPSTVTGTACGGCTVEIFIADSGANAYGEGRTFIGAGTAQGNGSFSIAVSGVTAGQSVTSTATDPAGNTSEFSQNRLVTAP